MNVKPQADVHVAGTNLDWVIGRPGTLTSRAFASINRIILELTSGDLSIPEALAQAGNGGKQA